MTDPATELVPGTMLAGKYRIERVLGRGGMGAVFLAENVGIGRKVAIKVMLPAMAQNPQILQRFRLEARAAGAIGHPGIVDVLDLGNAEGCEFIVMECLEGETFGRRIERAGRLTPEESVPIICEVLDALAAAHAKGIVHRDLKPENVFLVERPTSRAKILDFGISKFKGTEELALTQTGAVMGSPLYMSPEQARGSRDIGPATDLYSIGAILYESLVGRPPFPGQSYNEVIAAVLTDTHKPVVNENPSIPPALSLVIDALLAKSPADRPASAEDAIARLRESMGGSDTDVDSASRRGARAPTRPMQASITPSAATRPEVSPPERVVRRRRWQLAASMLFAASALALLGVAARRYVTPPSSPASVAAPASASSLAAAPAAASAIDTVALTLVAEPAAARWQLDGVELGCSRCELTRPRGDAVHKAVVGAPGHAPQTVEVTFDRAQELRVTLVPLAASKPRPTSPAAAARPSSPPAPSPTKPAPPSGMTIDRSNPFR